MAEEQTVNWNGKELTVTYEVRPAEPDVGIMSPYPDILSILDENGVELPPLSADEEGEILELIVIEEE